jgi:uncharacterized protein with PIN domain
MSKQSKDLASRRPPTQRARRFALVATVALLALFTRVSGAAADEDEGASDELCLACHGAMEGETHALPDGSTLDLYVDEAAWAQSPHRTEGSCTGCHTTISDYPHPELDVASAHAYQAQAAEQCNRCHYDYFTRFLDSMHYQQLSGGNEAAPNCVDCHGAHGASPSAQPRIAIDQRCGQCHEAISAAYRGSVHGRALGEQDTADFPVCTDCHGAHDVVDPRRPGFHEASHEICARCHGDQTLAERYDLNPYVATSYLDDFHGSSNALLAADGESPSRPLASCTDCHGVHDIMPFDDGAGAEAVRERVAIRCASCHEGANVNFADAWLSHYPPTLASAPMVWGVKWVYRILIPLIISGLVLHILLHLRQVALRKAR